MVYFAVEAAEDQQQTQTHESELDQAADDFAQAKLRAEKGGHALVNDGERAAKAKDTPRHTALILGRLAQKVKSVAEKRQQNLTPETTQELNDAKNELKNALLKHEGAKYKKIEAENQIKQLSSLPNAKDLFTGLEITFHSKSKGGQESFAWKPGDTEGFKQLGLDQKKQLIKEMHKRVVAPPENVDNSQDLEAMREKLLANPNIPESSKDWMRNPEKGFSGATEEQKTLAYVVPWVFKEQGTLTEQVKDFTAIAKSADAKPDAAKQLIEKGVRISPEEFGSLSRTERNDVLKQYSEVLAATGTDADLAKRAAEASISDDESSKKIQVENTAAIEAEQKENEVMAERLAPQLKDVVEKLNFKKQVDQRENEIKTSGEKETKAYESIADLRTQNQAGEGVGKIMMGKLKGLFGVKKSEAAEQERLGQTEEAEQAKQEQEEAEAALKQAQADELRQEAVSTAQQSEPQAAVDQTQAVPETPVEEQIVQEQEVPIENQNVRQQPETPLAQEGVDHTQTEQVATQKEGTAEEVNRQKEESQADKLRQQLASSAREQAPKQPVPAETQAAQSKEASASKLHMGDVQNVLPKKAEVQKEALAQPKEAPASKLHLGDVQKAKAEVQKETPRQQALRECSRKIFKNPESTKVATAGLELRENMKPQDTETIQQLFTLEEITAKTVSAKLAEDPKIKEALKRNAEKVTA